MTYITCPQCGMQWLADFEQSSPEIFERYHDREHLRVLHEYAKALEETVTRLTNQLLGETNESM